MKHLVLELAFKNLKKQKKEEAEEKGLDWDDVKTPFLQMSEFPMKKLSL